MISSKRRLLQVFLLLVTIVLSISCSEELKVIEIVLRDTERGAVLRTIERVNENFVEGDLSSSFSVVLEVQSITTNNEFEKVDVFLTFVDRAQNGAAIASEEVLLTEVSPSEFMIGPDGLPRFPLEFTYQEVINALGLNSTNIVQGDQFQVRLEITMLDGRSISTSTGSTPILTDFCSFKSPYLYIVNVIEPLNADRFTGNYFYEIIENTTDPDIFGLSDQGFANLEAIRTNVRKTGIFAEGLEFTFAGDFIYPKIFQAVGGDCRQPSLLFLAGPTESSFGSYDLVDDTVFELDVVVDVLGANTGQIRYRFTKQ